MNKGRARHDPALLPDLPKRMKIPVITLLQPWATWVAKGFKSIETRTHPRFGGLEGKRIAIHAGQGWDYDAVAAASPFWPHDLAVLIEDWGDYPSGAIICTAFVGWHRPCLPSDSTRALIECATRRFGLELTDIQVLQPPRACRGSQGIWYAEL